MSQKVTRKAPVTEDKEMKQSDGPVKEMKKKMAANAEKEKQAAEKIEKSTEKSEKHSEHNKDKPIEKSDKNVTEKKSEKNDKQHTEKPDKNTTTTEKKSEKDIEQKEPQAEKSKEDGEKSKEEKSGKSERSDQRKADGKPRQNGREQRVHNGVSDVTLSSNGASDEVLNGTVSADSEDDDVTLVIDDQDQDELFPELTYDDGSDVECFEPPTPEATSRSFTRRSQVKSTRTPETPRPASDKRPDKDAEDPRDSKVLKLKEDAIPTDRKLRSSDSPKPESKKESKKQESPKKPGEKENEKAQEKVVSEKETKSQEGGEKKDVMEVEVIVELESEVEGSRKTDTNYSKSRVKVSPYRRSLRLADQTNTSVLANYTGNNTTMEMDITETSSSFIEDTASLDDSSYLHGLRSIRGRTSYKPLKEINLRHLTASRSARNAAAMNALESHGRPTGTVVGRKRRPDAEEPSDSQAPPSLAESDAGAPADTHAHAHGKRMRLLDRLAVPFRRSAAARNPEIVGINTDLPLTAPVASADTFDPESLKSTVPEAPIAVPLASAPEERDTKRCTIM